MAGCGVCRHARKEEIEARHVAGASLDELSAEFGVHRSSLARHLTNHLTAETKTKLLCGTAEITKLKAMVAKDASSTLEILTIVRGVLLSHFLRRAEADETFKLAGAARALVDVVREVGKLRGEVQTLNPALVINNDNRTLNVARVTSSPAFRLIADGLMDLCRKYPDARTDIVALLKRAEGADASPPLLAAPEARDAA